MQIIGELEGEGRGPYTGALGYLDRSGDMDLNILIRSLWLYGREAGFRAGAGIVIDSDAAAELAETRVKARGLLRAFDPSAELVARRAPVLDAAADGTDRTSN
jgi:anthranilate synthase component 1